MKSSKTHSRAGIPRQGHRTRMAVPMCPDNRGRLRGQLLCIVFSASAATLLPSVTVSADTAVDYEVRRATQTVFRDIATRLRPFLVRIETVGGTQPGATIVEREEEGIEEEPNDGSEAPLRERRRRRNLFVDRPGSSFVVADGPTTGLVYSKDGYIITSSFNFAREPALISVVLSDGRRLAADLIARDQVRKIALLRVDATDLATPEWVPLDQVQVGQWAVALGLGFGGEEPSVTVGVVSALNRMRGNAIQTDAKLSPANYGGPLCDIDGRIIGMAVPMAQRPGELAGVEMYDSGVGFAVPKNRVDEIVAELKKGKTLQRGWLGIQVNLTSKAGVIIQNVADPSPMRSLGGQPGDRITWAEGRRVRHFGHLMQALYRIPAGEPVYLCMQRGDREFGSAVTLAASEELGDLPDLPRGFDLSDPVGALRRLGERDWKKLKR